METQTLGKYILKRHLATGGMAEIWLAEQSGPGGFQRELVIKRILPHLASDPDFTQMFLDEAHLVAQLNHPQIAQIFELGQIDGHYFIAMEFLDGIDVEQLINLAKGSGIQLPLNIACKVISDILLALDYAHEFTGKDGQPYHLVHRDISPQNVLISNDGVIKLVDFGVAKAVSNRSKTEPGGVKGKFAYMAPEQIQSKDVDRRADLFAVGLLLFETLTLSRPFGDDLQAVTGIMSLDPPDARTFRSDIPETLVTVIGKALQKDRDDRYFDANEMLRDISNSMLSVGGMVTDRDVSAYIRRLQGLPELRTSKTDIPTPYSPREETQVPGPRTPLSLTPSTGPNQAVASQLNATPQLTGAVNGAFASQPTMDLPMVEEKREKNTGLIFVMFFIAALIVALVIGGVVLLTQNSDEEKTSDPVAVEEKILNHQDGLHVLLITEPVSTLIFKGRKAGKTPFDTTLREGSYDVTFSHDGKEIQKTIVVKPGKMIQRFKFEL